MADDETPSVKIQYLDGDKETKNWIYRPGKAFVTYENGETYEGYYNKNGEKHGYGEYTYKVHDDEEDADKIGSYKGNWQQGRKHGKGDMKYPNGEEYNGTWYRNFRQGQGTYVYKNGDVYSGNWVADKKEGKGTLYNPKSSYQLVGMWQNNQLIRGKWIMDDGTIYNGFFDHNKPVGGGVFTFPNGVQVEGKFDKKRLKPGEEEEEEEQPDESDENYQGPKRYWYPSQIVVKGAEATEINRAETDPIDYIPIYREVQYLKVETFESFNDREIVTVYNEGLTDANLKGCYLGPYKFRNDHILISGHRVRILSGNAYDDPPLEYKDIQNIIWCKELMWIDDKFPQLWYRNEEGDEIVIHKLGETTNYEKYQIEEMKRLQELENLRIQREIEEKQRLEDEARRIAEEEAREKELAEMAEAQEPPVEEPPPETEKGKNEEGEEEGDEDDEDDDD